MKLESQLAALLALLGAVLVLTGVGMLCVRFYPTALVSIALGALACGIGVRGLAD